ncbi:hypothetical protein ABIE44_002703 [Marmoricola sp. OAE513]|uniref:hypothetical protein n=1 Tax=Marmoricola sp. OAE513 TaxID=2817894 RepID=UPI001AE3CED6
MTGTDDPDELTGSDPNGGGSAGLAGGMGVSSERVGKVRGSSEPQTHGVEETGVAAADDVPADPPPEQSAN